MNRRSLLVAGVIILLAVVGYRTESLLKIGSAHALLVALVYDPAATQNETGIRAAYDGYLQEQGMPYEWISNRDFMLLDGAQSAKHFVAVVFVDHLNRFVPSQTINVLANYVRAGGNVAIIADAGTRSPLNYYLRKGTFNDLAGVDYLQGYKRGTSALYNGPVRFASAGLARTWHVPPGKLTKDSTLSTYGYSKSTFPLQAARSVGASVIASSGSNAVITQRHSGTGSVVYIGIPLGAMRAFADAFPMHAFLGTFLRDVAKIPHFIAAPDGIGYLIVNFHIDSSIEFRGIPNLAARHLLRHDIPMEFDVTAGPDRDKPGDGLGFDACGKGKSYLRTIMKFGSIGSHGGWAHNAFAYGVETHRLSPLAIQDLIQKNNRCLQSQLGRAILGFAAPAGAHPQPEMTHALENLKMNAYYYAGDSAAPAERAFKDGTMVSSTVWAFPITPNGALASLGEMQKARVPPVDVGRWLDSTIDYAVDDRAIHLVYSHAYDLLYHPYQAPFSRFLDKASRTIRKHELQTGGLADAALFMDRLLQTKFSFMDEGGRLVVSADNPHGLEHLSFAVPRARLAAGIAVPAGLMSRGADPNFRYFSIMTNKNHADYSFLTGNP